MDEIIEENSENGSNSIKQLYFRELREDLLILEKERRRILNLMVYIFAVAAGAALIIYTAGKLFHSYGAGVAIALLLGVYPLVRFIIDYVAANSSYVSNYKYKIINKIVKFVDNNLNYYPDRMIDEGTFQDSKIFTQRIDRYRGEDFVNGIIGKTDIAFSEVHAEYKTETRDSKGRRQTQWHTIFKGIFFTADFNKEFESFTVIMPDNAERIFGKLGQKLQSLSTVFSTRELVKMENEEFEKYFAVFSPNQVEARYILTPSIMEKLVKFRKAVNREVYISFNFSRVFIALPVQGNLFEPTLYSTIVNFEPIERYYKIIDLMVAVVNELDLNTRIWSKE